MMRTECLSRLACKTPSTQPVVSLSSEPGQLNSTEFAGVLSGLSGYAEDFARAKYLDDMLALTKLRNHARSYAFGIAIRDKWKIVRGKPIVYNIGDLASIEAVGAMVCIKCKGIGLSGKRCQCGKGTKVIKNSNRAEFIGVARQHYAKCWLDKYESIYRYLCYFDDEIYRIINKK